MIHCQSNDVEETMQLGQALAALLHENDCIVLNGDLGSGKTQFAKGFAKGLGVDDEITSPTFNILLEYVGDELPLLHFDLYRLDEEEELEDIDFFGLLESGGICLIEWGDKFESALPDERVEICISTEEDGVRGIALEGRGARGKELEMLIRENDTFVWE